MKSLDELLQACAALHHHLCPRQVLGVRMGMLAGEILGHDLPQSDKRLLTIVETDGCGADGIAVATGCWVGHRTMRIEDYGKVAATFVDTGANQAVRIVPRIQARQLAYEYAPEAHSNWEAQLLGYQRMPAEELLVTQAVQLKAPIEQIISRAGVRVICASCGEEIMNEREIVQEGMVLCKSCAGQGYYSVVTEFVLSIARLAKPVEAV
jgi:formylmethanofuran dehydrogenase subunit E